MAKCDEGYACEICGRDVAEITDSGLYLRYVLGEVLLERLHLQREFHVRCCLALSQYIVDDAFDPVIDDGPFGKQHLDREYVSAEETRVTRGWRRLQELPTLGLALPEYPLAVTPG